MSTSELKSDIHILVNNTNDSRVLGIIYALLSRSKKSKNAGVKLSAAEKRAVDEALKSVKKGITFNHDKVMEEMQKKYPSLIK